jgi:hypothetical protein
MRRLISLRVIVRGRGRVQPRGGRNIEAALAEAGASLANVVRVKRYVPNIEDWPRIVIVLGVTFRSIRPAATALISGLIDPRRRSRSRSPRRA